MAFDRAALQQRLLESFRIEAQERLGVLADGFAAWRHERADPRALDTLFREVHNLKGAARAVGLDQFERICHALESLLDGMRSDGGALAEMHIAVGRRAIAQLQQLRIEQPVASDDCQALIDTLEAVARGDHLAPADCAGAPTALPAAAGITSAAAAPPTTARVPAAALNALLFHSETLLQHKLEADTLARQLRLQSRSFDPQRSRRLLGEGTGNRLRGYLETLPLTDRDALKALLDYAEWSQAELDRLHFATRNLDNQMGRLARGLAQLADAYERDLLAVLLTPASNLFDGLQTLVQELADHAGKQVELHLETGDLQVDKRILDGLRTPLLHLLRNAVDHGLGTPAEHAAFGKPPAGKLRVSIAQQSADRFRVTVSDNGRGIDATQLKARAQSAGLLTATAAAQLADADALNLIFAPGLSTSTMLTEISGRGLGMPIVQESIEQLEGRIEVHSTVGAGTSFLLDLPLSLATFRAVILRIAERVFAIPALAVEHCLRLPGHSVKMQENRPSVVLDGEVLPVWPLADVLGLSRPQGPAGDAELTLLLMSVRGSRFVLLIDELLGDQEINVKRLGPQLQRLRNVLGATALGSGELVPVLHPGDLYRSALTTGVSSLAGQQDAGPSTRRQRLLIAEDSFTSRGLLKAILEEAGYQVATANDGLDAWSALKQEPFDLLVSDVEMPRMDGFVLTSRLRADAALAHLPVILITALESAEDRARGLEAGASAYLVKSGLGQESLLDTIRRLI